MEARGHSSGQADKMWKSPEKQNLRPCDLIAPPCQLGKPCTRGKIAQPSPRITPCPDDSITPPCRNHASRYPPRQASKGTESDAFRRRNIKASVIDQA